MVRLLTILLCGCRWYRSRRLAPSAVGLALALGHAAASGPAVAASRVALVVGNSDYAHIGRLPNPANDAADVGAALRRLGFEVTVARDAGRTALNEALRAFTRRSQDADVALVFYAGHGMEMDGVNYLLPVDARLERDTDVRYETVELDDVLASTSGAGLRLVILDACRNNPLARSMRRTVRTRNVSNGSLGDLNEDLLGDETLVAYSAAAGTTADDGEGPNSPYASALLAHLEDPVDIGVMFRRVRARVLDATNERQRPHEYSSLLREHYLAPPPKPPGPDPTPVRWQAGEAFRDCDFCPDLVVVPAGTFQMGSGPEDDEADADEKPRHQVEVGRFALGRYEVAREEYAAFVMATGHDSGDGCFEWTGGAWSSNAEMSWRGPGFAQGDDHPVVCVSWHDAQAYTAWLSRETGASYRLPSEAEWEYAARAGATTRRYWGDSSSAQCDHANGADAAAKRLNSNWTTVSCDDGSAHTAAAGSYEANAFRLFDMLGNVWEWTEDCWHDRYSRGVPTDGSAWTRGGNCGRRVLRGGSWSNDPRLLRSAIRDGLTSGARLIVVGFRVARTLD